MMMATSRAYQHKRPASVKALLPHRLPELLHDDGALDLGSAFHDGGDQPVSRWNADDGSSEHVRNGRDDANAR